MIKIDPNYDVVLTYAPINEITGHLFECFDYYLFLRQHYNVGLLFFGGLTEEKLETVFNSKYNVDFNSIKHDIKFISEEVFHKEKLYMFGINTVVLLCDGNIVQLEKLKIKLLTKKLLGFVCFEKDEVLTTSDSMYHHIIYLKDYRIYSPNNLYKSINYVKKLPFKFYKTTTSPNKNIGMFYITNACRRVSPYIIKEYHEKSGCDTSIICVTNITEDYNGIEHTTQLEIPVEDFFSKFDTYIYTPVQRQFDCSSRLVTECFMHNKNVYLDLPYYDVALQTRYNDCITNLQSLNLTDSDEILNIIELIKNNVL